MSRDRLQRGQALVLTLVFMAVLLALSAAVIDVGAWYRAHRQVQATADAAALAGATELPESTGGASALASDYASRNGGGVSSGDITFSGTVVAEDTIQVTARKTVPGLFSKIMGLGSVTARAHAKALSAVPGEARWAAPIGVDLKHPMLQCEPLPCFNQQTQLDLKKTGPGAFRLINIDGSRGGTSPPTLADWMLRGFDGYMPLQWYYSDPGAKFNSSQMQSALEARIGSELLFPVYRNVRGGGANFEYEVVGWVGFHLTDFDARGNSGKLDGWFTRIIWEGIENTAATDDDFGARTISLVE
jgi:putative Flp pilus-assembly TadE/G-like protein